MTSSQNQRQCLNRYIQPVALNNDMRRHLGGSGNASHGAGGRDPTGLPSHSSWNSAQLPPAPQPFEGQSGYSVYAQGPQVNPRASSHLYPPSYPQSTPRTIKDPEFSSSSEPSQSTQTISSGYTSGYSSHGGQRSLDIESDSLSGIGSGFGINGASALHYKTQAPSAVHAPSYEPRSRSHPDSHPVPAYCIEGQNDEIEDTLDRRYQIQQNGFFKVGRVFSLLWHENVGRNGTLLTQRNIPVSIGRYNEKIYSSIRRMVVVKQQDRCSWCIPVSTYSGQGLSKPGVDASKHAIIYMQGYQPTTSPDEPLITKKPLEVQPARPDQKLEPMSRLNFGKVYTVEHNVKVLHVGKITPASMDDFRAYVKNEFNFGH